MQIEKEGIDDVLHVLYEALRKDGRYHKGSRGGTRELLSVAIRIRNARARISRSEDRGKPFSAVGELLWYLAGSNKLEFIVPYIDLYKEDAEDDGTLHGAYGPRLVNMRDKINQLENVVDLLKAKPGSKRAVIQLFDANDLVGNFKEIPCTTTAQFLVREGRVHLSVTMRSNDAYYGLPHDVFCFTMLQEMVARRLGYDIGEYYHYVGSMHVYEDFLPDLDNYLEEGWHRTESMPPMPEGNPFDLVGTILKAEAAARSGETFRSEDFVAEPYWADVLRLVQVFWASGNGERLDQLKSEFHSQIYRTHLESRRHLRRRVNLDTVGEVSK
ncbi:thymidylate synthase [Rhizobium hidalgonense]|uniref:thymidylate synthase n=1 Tax=Rhizobium hidalgonense TaxID=1538159 RepID=A0ABX4JUC4_9HYPH|nr:thymidylate synthase [Rhizobium hidalgonense]PDT22317.1 thymidylate synthase [Rhizobium hidalgonense]PON08979.1 thymidylate synthase [Rhizobium hidalgonense]